MLRLDRLDPDRAFVLVIDLQAKLLPLVVGQESIIRACCELLEGVAIFELPVIATEQYPKGLGACDPAICTCLEDAGADRIEKSAFSAGGEQTVREALARIDRQQAIVVGIESHVCVQQTVLDLLAMDYDVFVCADAIGSRGRQNHQLAMNLMSAAGGRMTSVESVLFELCERCDTTRFKKLIEIIKAYPPRD